MNLQKTSKYGYIRKIKPSVLSTKMKFDSMLLSPTTFSTTKKGDRAESVEEENVRIPSRLSKRLRPTSLRKRFQYRDDPKEQLDEGTQRKRLTSQDGIGEKTFHIRRGTGRRCKERSKETNERFFKGVP